MPELNVDGLTEGEQREIENRLKSFYSENSVTSMYSPFYGAFAKSIYKKTTAEAQIELNKWNARGLNKPFLLTIAKNICNKELV